MKAFNKCILILCGILVISAATAQESFKVLMPSIADHYTGDCKKGKTSGKGKAEGTDPFHTDY